MLSQITLNDANYNAADISKKLIELEEAKFISRTNYNADQGIARAYLLNDRL